jgi:hypothetical protein
MEGYCSVSYEEYVAKHGDLTGVPPYDLVETLVKRLETTRRAVWDIFPEPTTLRFAENFQSLLRKAGAQIAPSRVAAEILEAMVQDVENLTEDIIRRWEEWREANELDAEEDF